MFFNCGEMRSLSLRMCYTKIIQQTLARCLFDEQKYPQACDIYRKIQQLEPHRLAGMEYYSTCLFYKEDAKSLSGAIFNIETFKLLVYSPLIKLLATSAAPAGDVVHCG